MEVWNAPLTARGTTFSAPRENRKAYRLLHAPGFAAYDYLPGAIIIGYMNTSFCRNL
jgi:hypothetical protein